MFDSNDIQTSIFHGSEQQLEYAELCTALFESTLLDIAKQENLDTQRIQRKLAGLSYHVKNAAYKLLTTENPMSVDIHNASWQLKQPRKCPGKPWFTEEAADWYMKHSCHGLPVPVLLMDFEHIYLELDSIDILDLPNQRIHLNKNDWVSLKPEPETQPVLHNKQQQLVILQKPSKAIMSSACCGHRWSHKGITHPRKLSLRELLLSTTIHWKNFRFPV